MSNVRYPESQGAQPDTAAVPSPHISISDQVCRLELAACRIRELHDRVLNRPTELYEAPEEHSISFSSVLHNTPERLMALSNQIENDVADLENTLFS